MDKDVIKELEEIYMACNDERVWQIQKRLSRLLKGLCEKSTNTPNQTKKQEVKK